jgi:hypothetical protein
MVLGGLKSDGFAENHLRRPDGRGPWGALAAAFPCGGGCPADRQAEDGPIPAQYPVTPLPRGGYRERTLKNVLDSDATVILFRGELTGGTLLTRTFCQRHGKPHLVIDAAQTRVALAVGLIVRFVERHGTATLNVAGPRLSGWPEGEAFSARVVAEVLKAQTGSAGE